MSKTTPWFVKFSEGVVHNDLKILMWSCISRDVQQLSLMTSELVNIQVDREQPYFLSLFSLQECLVIAP